MIMSTKVSSFFLLAVRMHCCFISLSLSHCHVSSNGILILLILIVVLNFLSHFLKCKPCFILSTLISKFYVPLLTSFNVQFIPLFLTLHPILPSFMMLKDPPVVIYCTLLVQRCNQISITTLEDYRCGYVYMHTYTLNNVH